MEVPRCSFAYLHGEAVPRIYILKLAGIVAIYNI